MRQNWQMFIDPKIQNRLTPSVQHMVFQLGEKEQELFWMQFSSQSKDPTTMTLLAIFFPIQFFVLGEIGLGIAFMLTAHGCLVWGIIEWFLAAGRTRKYNDRIAITLIQGIRMSSQSGGNIQPQVVATPPPPPVFSTPRTIYPSQLTATPMQLEANANSEINCNNCNNNIIIPGELKWQPLQCPHCATPVKL